MNTATNSADIRPEYTPSASLIYNADLFKLRFDYSEISANSVIDGLAGMVERANAVARLLATQYGDENGPSACNETIHLALRSVIAELDDMDAAIRFYVAATYGKGEL